MTAMHRRLVAGALPARGRVHVFGDITDIFQPFARRMEGQDQVRDSSNPAERVGPGYWMNEVCVGLDMGRPAPVVAEICSLRSGRTLSQTEVVLRGMDEAFEVTGSRGVFVEDPVRFLKQVFRVEKYLLRSLRAMRLRVFFIAITMAIQGTLLLPGAFSRETVARAEWFRGKVTFLHCRMARALPEWPSGLPLRLNASLLGARGP